MVTISADFLLFRSRSSRLSKMCSVAPPSGFEQSHLGEVSGQPPTKLNMHQIINNPFS